MNGRYNPETGHTDPPALNEGPTVTGAQNFFGCCTREVSAFHFAGLIQSARFYLI
jgi:hypothetical protein